ncbi:MAG TPA: phosphoglycerate dehydrogenase [Anaerolineaceae bacterium]|jgi:D-3-phosphoglycerate dehydrogenase|nr:phosphoglycerate dehydrogenase [Anaerolineaceae bacterium]
MPVVLLSAPYLLPFVARFRPIFAHYGLELIVPEVHERLSETELLALAGQFDATICGDDRYTPRVLAACAPRLKVISKWGTGIDSIDQPAAARLGIAVRNTPNAFTLPVSDSVLGYILAFARRQPWMDRAMKTGEWQKIPGRSLSECTLGVIGVGNVGKAVLRRARAFGMTLLGNDIVPIAPDFLLENHVINLPLEDLLAHSDYISLNCDLNPTSHHLINDRTLDLVRTDAVLINTARGPIVDEPALIASLQAGRLGGAALDVFEVEPLPADSPLLHLDNVMLAPHNSNSSPAAWERVHWNTIRNLLDSLGIPAADLADWQARP